MRTKLVFAGVIVGVFALTQTALAAELIFPDKTGVSLISEKTAHRNVYTAGGNVTVTSNIAGDLVAAGGNVLIQGNVEQDLIAAGGTLNISGDIGGDIRVAGGNVTITGPVNGDAIVAGGNLTLARSSRVGGDLIIAGGNVTVEVPVTGRVRIMGGRVTINSEILGPVEVTARRDLVFGPQSSIPEKVTYHGRKPAELKDGAKVPTIEFKKLEFPRKKLAARFFAAAVLFKLIAFLIAALLLLKFLRRRATAIVNKAYENPWVNLGWGLVFAIVLPVAAVIAFATLVGVYVGLILLAWLFLAAILVSIMAAMFFGSVLMKWFKQDHSLRWQTATLGVIALGLIGLVPVLGPLVFLVLWLITFGALLRVFKTEIA